GHGFIDIAKDGAAVTRILGIAIDPAPSPDGSLYFMSLEPDGFVVRHIDPTPPDARPTTNDQRPSGALRSDPVPSRPSGIGRVAPPPAAPSSKARSARGSAASPRSASSWPPIPRGTSAPPPAARSAPADSSSPLR